MSRQKIVALNNASWTLMNGSSSTYFYMFTYDNLSVFCSGSLKTCQAKIMLASCNQALQAIVCFVGSSHTKTAQNVVKSS